MTEKQIKIDFEEAKKCAKELLETSNEVKALVKETLEDVVDAVNSNWTGDNATKFLRKLQSLDTEILETTECVEESSAAVTKIAKSTYDAEMRALEIARKRTAK